MNVKFFNHPVTLVLLNGSYLSLESTFDAFEWLMSLSHNRAGKDHIAALDACVSVLNGDLAPSFARSALMSAAAFLGATTQSPFAWTKSQASLGNDSLRHSGHQAHQKAIADQVVALPL